MKAVDGAGNTGNFGGPFTFTALEDVTPPGRPTLEGPGSTTGGRLADQDLQPTPVFRWSAVTDPSGVTYELEITTGGLAEEATFVNPASTTGDFLNPVFTADRIPETETFFTLVGVKELPAVKFIWHVRAIDEFGNTGDFSVPFIFDVFGDTEPPTIPELLSPATGDNVVTARPTFQWTRSTDPSTPVKYTLEIAVAGQTATGTFVNPAFVTGDFVDLVFRRVDIPDDVISIGDQLGIQFRLPVQLPGGTFIWHVRSKDKLGNTGDFSDTRIFTVVGTTAELTMEPFLSGPGTGDYVPTLRWRAVPEAVRYEISVDNRPFRDIGTGDPGAPDGEVRFELKKPLAPPSMAPVLVSPLGGITTDDTTPSFTWRPVTGDLSPVTYTLEIDNATGDFTAPISTGKPESTEGQGWTA